MTFIPILQRWGCNQSGQTGWRVVQERRHWQNRRRWLLMVKVRSILSWHNTIQNNMILTIDRGRIKEMMVTAGGLNVAPVPIENRIKKDLSSIIREFCSAKLLWYSKMKVSWMIQSMEYFWYVRNLKLGYSSNSNVMIVGDEKNYLTCLGYNLTPLTA